MPRRHNQGMVRVREGPRSHNRASAPSYALNAGNLIANPDAFDNASWAKTAITVTANQAVAPDGTTTMDLAVPTAASSGHWVTQTSGFAVTTAFTAELWGKASGYGKIALRENSLSGAYAAFDLGTGTFLASGNAAGVTVSTPTITAMGGGVYKMTAVFTVPSSGNYTVGPWLQPPAYASGDPTGTWTGDGTSGIYLWHGQAY